MISVTAVAPKPLWHDIYVGNGCEAYSNNLFIPAKSELTSTDSSLVRHNYLRSWNCPTNTKRNSQNT